MKSVFNKEDFNSGDGMMTHVWGPSLWMSIHTMSFNYPVKPTAQDKKHYMNFMYSLEHVLPCRYCRDNYKENLKKLKFGKKYFKSRDTLSKFVYKLHEMINKNLGKESGLTYTQVRDRYEHFRARCLNDDKPKKETKIEKGCTDPLYGVKSKCVMNIVPKNSKKKSLTIDSKCKIKNKK